METGLRLLLLIVGFVIIAGIIWDNCRDKKKKKSPVTNRDRTHDNFATTDLDADLNELDIAFDEPSFKTEANEKLRLAYDRSKSIPSEIISLHIFARSNKPFTGEKLLDAFTDFHLYYGDMQIFHRFEERDGSGEIVFSVMSSIEPGYFVLSKMAEVKTPAITLFFTITEPNQSVAAFELMLRTAKQLAMRLDGELKDDGRQTLTIHGIEKYRERIRLKSSTRVSSQH